MTPNFTPRSTPHPSSTAEEVKTIPKKPVDKPSWQVWKPRLITFARWILKQLKWLWAGLVRYAHGLSRTQRIQHAAIILGLIICLFVFNQIFSRHISTPQTAVTDSGAAQLPKGTPDFSTILPAGKTIDKFGGWTRTSPSDRNSSYVYADTLAGVIVRVNEQQIPDTFKSDPSGSVEKLANDFGATHTLDAGNTKVYIGKNAKGPQSLIFIKHDLLISITSNGTIPDDQWISYIKSLQ